MKGEERSLKLRFHKQEKAYSCAVACLKMIFFPIVYVNTYFLNEIFATHAIIVEDITDEEVSVIDPVEGRKKISLEIFKRIWDFCNNLTVVIERG